MRTEPAGRQLGRLRVHYQKRVRARAGKNASRRSRVRGAVVKRAKPSQSSSSPQPHPSWSIEVRRAPRHDSNIPLWIACTQQPLADQSSSRDRSPQGRHHVLIMPNLPSKEQDENALNSNPLHWTVGCNNAANVSTTSKTVGENVETKYNVSPTPDDQCHTP